jgi:hypothetical protein
MRAAMCSDHAIRIMETVEELNKLLDVEKPWTWIVHDPSGMSEFKPDDGVQVEVGVAREEAAEEAAEEAVEEAAEEAAEQQPEQQPEQAAEQQPEQQQGQQQPAADTTAAQQQLESLD